MLTVSQLLNLDLARVQAAMDEWGKMASRLGAYQDRVREQMSTPLSKSWMGISADYAQVRLANLEANLHYGHQECSIIKDALGQIHWQLQGCQRDLQGYLDQVPKHDFEIKDNGDVVYTGPAQMQLDSGSPLGTHRSAPGSGYEEQIKGELKKAADIDDRYSHTLAKLRTNSTLHVKKHDAAHDAKALDKTSPDIIF